MIDIVITALENIARRYPANSQERRWTMEVCEEIVRVLDETIAEENRLLNGLSIQPKSGNTP